jgi:methyl-accepting chemotaxis protein
MDRLFADMKVGTKILVICLLLAIIPTSLVGVISYTSSTSVINQQIEMLLQTQSTDMKGWTNDVYTLTMNKVDSDLNVLRQRFYEKGTPEIIDGKMTLVAQDGSKYVVNDNFEIVDQVQGLVGGAATVFQVYDDHAIRIATNVISQDGERAVGTRLTDDVFNHSVIGGETFYGSRDLFEIRYVTAYEPIRNSNGEVIGILFVGTKETETLDVVRNSIRQTVIGQNGYMKVIDGEGNVIVHPRSEGENWVDRDFVQTIIAEKEGILYHTVDGNEIIDVYTYFEPLDWHIVSRAYLADFTGPINTIRDTLIAVILTSIIVGAVVAILFGRSISDPLQQVVLMIKDLRNGHLSTRLNIDRKDEIGIMAKTMDEFAENLQTNIVGNIKRLANGEYVEEIEIQDERDEIRPAIRMMMESLDHLHKETLRMTDAAWAGDLKIRGDEKAFHGSYRRIIAGFNKTLDRITEPVNEAMRLAGYYAAGDFTARFDPDIPVAGEFIAYRDALNTIGIELSRLMKLITEELYEGISVISSASSEIIGVTSHLSSESSQTVRIVDETTNAVESVRIQTDRANQKTREVTEKAMKTSFVSKDGQRSIQEILDGMNQIRRQMDVIGTNVVKLSEQSNAVGEIIATVTDISEQSNLLAVNASIEAAKAGEFGKGFAVVADEIHNLAEQSKQATSHIRTILTDIQRGVSGTVVSVDRGSASVEDTVRLTSQAREAIEVLASAVADSSKEAYEIADSIAEQASGMDRISHAMEKIQEAARKNLENTQKAEKTAEDLHELGIRLKKITEQYHV